MELLTPMMKQYNSIKSKYKDEIVFFRLGDFYEMFESDAKKASKILGIALTKRNGVFMCGVPYHAKDNYLFKLLKEGFKVVICDQLEDSSKSKGLIQRGVTEILTPGTLIDNEILDQLGQKNQNYIASFYFIEILKKKNKYSKNLYHFGISYLDLSTGDFYAYESKENNLFQIITNHLYQINPKELVLASFCKENIQLIKLLDKYKNDLSRNFIPDDYFYENRGRQNLKNFFKVTTLRGFGIDSYPLAIGCVSAIIYYLNDLKLFKLDHIFGIQLVKKDEFMQLNETSIRNLELIQNINDQKSKDTLYSMLNNCKNSMGSRLLRQWILNPLLNVELIKNRQNIVAYLIDSQELLNDICELLNNIIDIERLLGKIALKKVNPLNLLALKQSLIYVKELILLLKDHDFFNSFVQNIPDLSKMHELIEKSIDSQTNADFQSAKVIKYGYNKELDELKQFSQKNQKYLINLQEKEKKKLGISTLKIKYNKIIGYFIEISNNYSKSVPDHYVKKQSLSSVSRYSLPEITEYESRILQIQNEVINLEKELFDEICVYLIKEIAKLKKLSKYLAQLDIFCSFSNVAKKYNYCRPIISKANDLIIKSGRHPVIEKELEEKFIPNDVILNQKESRLNIITGPNMAGKSTYLRQTALIVIMAQIGSFVPATYASISIVDHIFTRIGASDNLIKGESTFLVEMIETAFILNNATNRSLIIMDEVGRGTSTYDGLSIAWSLIEYLTEPNVNLGKILFATHYHELTVLSKREGVVTSQVLIKEKGNDIIFLHKVEKGISHKSYGLQVARLAGLPDKIINRSKDILFNLEKNKNIKNNNSKLIKNINIENQLNLFKNFSHKKLLCEILKINPYSSTLKEDIITFQKKIKYNL